MINMFRVDGRAAAEDTPLFRDPNTNQPISYETLHALVKEIVRCQGLDPEEYGSHSIRIGGATALFAAGATPLVIRTMGRWSSDIYRIYVRTCVERCTDWTKAACSQEITGAHTFDEVDDY